MVPAVKRPDARSIEPPPATTDQVGEIATTLPAASVPTAVNCCVAPAASDAGLGVTVMLASGPAVTMTVAVLVRPPVVALTVPVNVSGVVPAVNMPELVIVPPPATTDQVGVTATVSPAASTATAENCCVPFTARDFGSGEMVNVAILPGSLIPWTSQPAADTAASTSAATSRAVRTCGASGRMMRP